MKRFLFGAAMIAAFSSVALAQPVPGTTLQPSTVPQTLEPLPPPPPPAVYYPNVYIPPGSPAGPAIPFFRSGGVVVGAYGYYPYDTGVWLLAGTQGLTRQTGSFTMVYPAPPPIATEVPVVPNRSLLRFGRFCR